MNTFYQLKFHTNLVEFSPRASLAFQSKEAHSLIERHYSGDWGYLDEADLDRNEQSLQKKSGTVCSRFQSALGDQVLIVESDLTGHSTYAFLLGEEF